MALNELIEIYRERPVVLFYTLVPLFIIAGAVKGLYNSYRERRNTERTSRILNERTRSHYDSKEQF
ncbi:MAG: hypothetical protein KKG75_00415 [Nanoarchaeota archaeon]|nr:hypothetical protein [Nanoarchaeota archaeon]